jgi:hypothetical protein
MQNFAINGGALNGDPQVWIDDASLGVVLQADGDVMLGRTLAGGAQVIAAADLSLSLQAKLQGLAGIAMAATGQLTYGVSLVGASPIVVSTTGDGVRWAMIQGDAPTVLAADGDLQVVPPVSATFDIVASGDLELHVATGHQGEGYAPIVMASDLQAYVTPATILSGLASIEAAGLGQGNLLMASPPGEAAIVFVADGAARYGARLSLEGDAVLELYSRGCLDIWHYVYAEGEAAIQFMAMAASHGIPVIPSQYVAAPIARALRVGEENRRFIVPAERRL